MADGNESLAAAPAGDAEPVEAAARIRRGVRRALLERGFVGLAEFSLRNGRRADVLAINGASEVVIVEVKSSVADFRADHKWPEYRDFCDAFYFAVGPDFPATLIPDDCGLMIADGFGAAVVREAPAHKLHASRRKALLLQVALVGCSRLHRVEDPWLGGIGVQTP
ncbi:MAG: MmcB family DNA repair protein [Azospirillum sp.]|nr:MmcB family DNA repair protein [Azospirillum sp.]